MIVIPPEPITGEFSTYNSSGALTNADSTPTGTLVAGATDSGATVTVSNPSTGRYKFTVSTSGLAWGSLAYVRIAATVGGVTQEITRGHCRLGPPNIRLGGISQAATPDNLDIKLQSGHGSLVFVGDVLWLSGLFRRVTAKTGDEVSLSDTSGLTPASVAYPYFVAFEARQLSDEGHAAAAADAVVPALTSHGVSTLTQSQVTGGAYPLDTNASGQMRVVHGTNSGEIPFAGGYLLVDIRRVQGTNAGLVSGAVDANVVSINGVSTAISGGSGNVNFERGATVSYLSSVNAPAGWINADAIANAAADKIAERLLKLDWTGLTGEAARSVLNALRAVRNRHAMTGARLVVYKENDTTVAWEADVATSGSAEPLTGVDPD